MSRRDTRRKPMAEINVVPYIDVTLVLMIIFMITAPLIPTGVEVELPQAEAQEVSTDEIAPVIISIDKQGEYYIDLGGKEAELVQAEELLVLVAAVLRNKPKTQIFIRGDKAVDYGKVVTVMAALKKAGVPSVGLMTRPES